MNLYWFWKLTSWEFVFIYVYAVVVVIQLFYYLYFYLRISAKQKWKPSENQPPVSVVICARNEAENLLKNLPQVLKQDYPEFEVVVVNDCSTDDSEWILKQFQLQYKNLKITHIKPDDKFTHGKKLALTIGIKATKFDYILLTDADCRPASTSWIKHMISAFNNQTEIVLGYSGAEHRNGLINKLLRHENTFTAIQYISFAMAGIPYMGVGRNLAYRKDLYFRNKGFASHSHIMTGDDDLFINQVASEKNTSVMLHPDSFTITVPKKNVKDWFIQKRRHVTSGFHYRLSHKILLAIEPLSRMLFYLLPLGLIWLNQLWVWIVSMIIIRITIHYITMYIAMKKFKQTDFLIYTPIFDFIYPLFQLSFVLLNKFDSRQVRWM